MQTGIKIRKTSSHRWTLKVACLLLYLGIVTPAFHRLFKE